MAPYHILIVIISSVIPENLVLLTKSEQSGPKSAHIRPTKTHYHTYHTPKQKKIKFKPRITLNHNRYTIHFLKNYALGEGGVLPYKSHIGMCHPKG